MISLALFSPARGASAELSGTAEVNSGDTLTISGTRVRLVGIEAPNKEQNCQVASGRTYNCGRISATALMDLTVAATVSCSLTGTTISGVPLAKCTAGGYDLSKGMVHTGWALAWPRTGTIYAAVEAAARQRKHGLWRGVFETPWEWRRKRAKATK